MTRTVYTAECHTCHTTQRFDTWHQRHHWITEHTLQPLTIMGRPIPQDHNIHHYTQQWNAHI